MLTFWIGQHCWWSPTVQQVVSRPKQQELSGQVLFSSPHSGESTKSPDDYNFRVFPREDFGDPPPPPPLKK